MQSDGVPGRLDSSVWHSMMLKELADGVCTVDFETIGRAAELLQ